MAERELLYHVPRSQVWQGSRGRQSGRVHIHVNGRALCGVRTPWYPRPPLEGEQMCSRCEARAARLEQGEALRDGRTEGASLDGAR